MPLRVISLHLIDFLYSFFFFFSLLSLHHSCLINIPPVHLFFLPSFVRYPFLSLFRPSPFVFSLIILRALSSFLLSSFLSLHRFPRSIVIPFIDPSLIVNLLSFHLHSYDPMSFIFTPLDLCPFCSILSSLFYIPSSSPFFHPGTSKNDISAEFKVLSDSSSTVSYFIPTYLSVHNLVILG